MTNYKPGVYIDIMSNAKLEDERPVYDVSPQSVETAQKFNQELWTPVSRKALMRTNDLSSKALFMSLDTDNDHELSKSEIEAGLKRSAEKDTDRQAGLKMLHESFDDIRGVGRFARLENHAGISRSDIGTLVEIATLKLGSEDKSLYSPELNGETRRILWEKAMPNSSLSVRALALGALGVAIGFALGGRREPLILGSVLTVGSVGRDYFNGRDAVNSRVEKLDRVLSNWTARIGAPASGSDSRNINSSSARPKN